MIIEVLCIAIRADPLIPRHGLTYDQEFLGTRGASPYRVLIFKNGHYAVRNIWPEPANRDESHGDHSTGKHTTPIYKFVLFRERKQNDR